MHFPGLDGKENDKMPGFQGFPGRVGTLLVLLHHINAHIKYC